MNDATKPDPPEPPLVGEVTPPRSIGGRQYRSASYYGNCTLTVKQEAFAQAVTYGGMNHSDAYRHTYDASSMTPKSVWQAAWQVANNAKVAQRIVELASERMRQELHDQALMRVRAISGLLEIAETARSDAARVAAWRAILDQLGPEPDPKPVEDAASLRLELVKRLRALLPPDK
jgi:hypothetical protein